MSTGIAIERSYARMNTSNERILQILQAYARKDFVAEGAEYVRNMFTDVCGCTRKEIEDIGFGWLFDDGQDKAHDAALAQIDMDFADAVTELDGLNDDAPLLVENGSGDTFQITKRFDKNGMYDPRTSENNLGVMVCWHPKYKLGDEQPDCSIDKWLSELLQKKLSGFPYYGAPLYDFLSKGTDCSLLTKENGRYTLHIRQNKSKAFTPLSTTSTSDDIRDIPDWFLRDCCMVLTEPQAIEILTKLGYYFIPICFYEYAGLRMYPRTSCNKWHLWQVGWIYTTHERAKALWGKHWDKARATRELTEEVRLYSEYLSGTAHGIIIRQLDKGAESDDKVSDFSSAWVYKDSRWGLQGARQMVSYIASVIGNYNSLRSMRR